MIYARNLCELYDAYNRREYVHPDPLEFLYDYKELRDREIVGLIASSLAYGAVRQILKSVGSVLGRMDSPYLFLRQSSKESLRETFKDFKHRFTTGDELSTMLYGIKKTVERYGSLQECFAQGFSSEQETVIPALSSFVDELRSVFDGRPRSLLPSPDAGSACKRLNLFLRWMVRRDQVDPGGWDNIPASSLIVPLDVHMHRISLQLGLTKRKQADLRAACEITAAFRGIEPEDPVRYDFVLTRLGIRDDLDPEEFLKSCRSDD
ncbi:MAG TPA: TIGR02757 family protein [Desulfomonilaceae bacterium]|nr:TIGR02757 family protein [Desulfomonilaceae bacterium]